MLKRKAPVEIAGYVNRLVCVVDMSRAETHQRWMSVFNDNYDGNEFLPWSDDSSDEDCPF